MNKKVQEKMLNKLSGSGNPSASKSKVAGATPPSSAENKKISPMKAVKTKTTTTTASKAAATASRRVGGGSGSGGRMQVALSNIEALQPVAATDELMDDQIDGREEDEDAAGDNDEDGDNDDEVGETGGNNAS
jgi:hypothetical protein